MIDHLISKFYKLDPFGKGLVIYFFLLFLVWIYGIFFSKSAKKGTVALNTNKKRFVEEVVRWGLMNIDYKGAHRYSHKVNVEVSYYKHKKRAGVFYTYNRRIRIYVHSNYNLDQLITTTLHEVVHYYQCFFDPKRFDTRYNELLKTFTYEKHPMEIEANQIAAQYLRSCRDEMLKLGYLKEE